MKILMNRYFGTNSITKSMLTVMAKSGRVLMQCEAREPRFSDYAATFPGCSFYCLAEGAYPCKPLPTRQSPMTLTVIKSPGHRCCRFGWEEFEQKAVNRILVGEANEEVPPDVRQIHQQRDTFMRLTGLVYKAYAIEEPVMLEITNEILRQSTLYV